jgi:nitroreductase
MTEEGESVLAAIRSRRVVRAMAPDPVPRALLEKVLDAARWAPSAGNRHLQQFAVTDDPATLRVLRMVSPGMLQRPAAAIVICTDRARAAEYGFAADAPGLLVDVGTAAATILLAAHAVGIGAGPVTSFSRAAAAVVLRLPPGWRAEMIICLGYPASGGPAPMASGRRRLTWQDLTRWVPESAHPSSQP